MRFGFGEGLICHTAHPPQVVCASVCPLPTVLVTLLCKALPTVDVYIDNP